MPFQVTEVQKHLKGVDDPATREELASRAERNGAAPRAGRGTPQPGQGFLQRTQRRHEGAQGIADRLRRPLADPSHHVGTPEPTTLRSATVGLACRPLRVALVAPPWFEAPPAGYGGIEVLCRSAA
jgi:Protein of unknown function (DUF2795)